MNKPLSEPYLFTVRVWLEEIDTGQVECRGRIQYGLDGPAWHFQGWAALIDLMHNVVRPERPENPDGRQGEART